MSLKQIAEHAGVSVMTVSAALNGTGRVSDQRRKEIMKIAERLNYQPNTLARMLKAKHKDAIGLIINERLGSVGRSGSMTELMLQFIKFCEKHDKKYSIEFCDIDSKRDEVPDILSSGYVGGVISAGFIFEHQTRFKDWLGSHPDFPLVKFEEPYDYCVRTDFVNGVLNAMMYLKECGHTRIGLHIGPQRFGIHNLIHRGFQQGIGLLSMECRDEWIYSHDNLVRQDDRKEKMAWMKRIMRKKDRPTAMICAGMGASRNIINFAYQLNLDVPGDLSLICTGEPWLADAIYPYVTTIERDIVKIVESAFDILQVRMNQGKITNGEKWINPKIVKRETVISLK